MTEESTIRRVGLFGGTFDPLHMGHVQLVRTVLARLKFDRIYVVPAAQSPQKPLSNESSPQDRLAMCQIGFESDGPQVIVDDREIRRAGISYTVATIESFRTEPELRGAELFLIMGLDQFEEFDRWHRFERIIEMANVVVVTRPGHQLPISVKDFPEGLQPYVADFEKGFGAFQSSRTIEFVRLVDQEISSHDVRKRLRTGRPVERLLSFEVEAYIKEKDLYKAIGPAVGDFVQFTRFCAGVLQDRKGIQLKAFDLRSVSAPSEFALVVSGTSTRHAGSLAEGLVKAVKEEFGVYPQSIEGQSEGRWVLVDYGSLIVHVFYDFVRNEYRLEELWKSAPALEL